MAELILSGYLYKAPPRDKLKNMFADKWKRRWFKLWSNKNLAYFEDYNCPKPKGDILLDKVEVNDIKHTLVLEKRNWVISIDVKAQNREYFLAADDEETMLSWFRALKQALKVDYISVTEIASTNLMRLDSDSSEIKCDTTISYLQIQPDGLERVDTDDSTFIDADETPEFDLKLDTKRESTVSPYIIYDQDSIQTCNTNIQVLEKSDSDELVKNEDGVYYTPMRIMNSLSSMDEEPLACSPEPNGHDSSDKDGGYVITPFEEREKIRKNSEFSQMKPSPSFEIYETMNSPTAKEPETIHAYDHLDDLEEIMQKIGNQNIAEQEDRVVSSDYDDIFNFKIRNSGDEEIPVPIRPNRSYTDIPVDNGTFEPPKLPPKSTGMGLKDDFRKSVLGQFQILLESYWVMYIFLPNRYIMKELVNIEFPVDNLIQKLAKLFAGQKHHHDFNLYVISDVHQTFEAFKKTEKDNARNDRRLNNDMSFVKQGINSAKLLQLVSIKEIDQEIFNKYLKDKAELNLTQKFCETWIPFVRGYFSIPDLREVAALSGYIHYVYQTTFTSKSISYDIFLPKNAREIPECIKTVREQSLELRETPIQVACANFMNRLAIWPTANTIAFPIKRIGKGMMSKQSDLLIVFANDHIGIVKADKNTDYSNFIYWWHKLDIGSFSINAKEILIIKLTKPIDEGSCEFLIKSSMNKIMCQLLENFLTAKKVPLLKQRSLGLIGGRNVRKGLPELPI